MSVSLCSDTKSCGYMPRNSIAIQYVSRDCLYYMGLLKLSVLHGTFRGFLYYVGLLETDCITWNFQRLSIFHATSKCHLYQTEILKAVYTTQGLLESVYIITWDFQKLSTLPGGSRGCLYYMGLLNAIYITERLFRDWLYYMAHGTFSVFKSSSPENHLS